MAALKWTVETKLQFAVPTFSFGKDIPFEFVEKLESSVLPLQKIEL